MTTSADAVRRALADHESETKRSLVEMGESLRLVALDRDDLDHQLCTAVGLIAELSGTSHEAAWVTLSMADEARRRASKGSVT